MRTYAQVRLCITVSTALLGMQGVSCVRGLPAAYHVQPWASGEFLGLKKEVAMEPLVGHLRHPYGLKGCVPDSEQVCHLQLDQPLTATKQLSCTTCDTITD